MFVFNQVLGQVAYYGNLPGGSDELILAPFEVSEVIDEDLLTIDTLEDLKLSLTESPIGRRTATSASAADGLAILTNDGWLAPAVNPQITRLVICYSPTGGALDSAILPMVSIDIDWTPDGVTDLLIDLSSGYFQASGYTYI